MKGSGILYTYHIIYMYPLPNVKDKQSGLVYRKLSSNEHYEEINTTIKKNLE